MVNVQLENGYTQIANPVMDRICSFKLDGTEIRVLLFIIRKTWGWKKKEDKISYSQIAKGVGISRRRAIRTVNRLVSHKTLAIKKGKTNTIRFNKQYDEWVVSPRTPPSVMKDTTLVSPVTPVLVSQKTPTKEILKETITKETIPNGIEGTKINHFIGMFKSINPSFERLYAQKGQREAMSRLVSQYGEQKVENMLRELPVILQKPYAPMITTPYQLEQKLGALLIFIKKEGYGQSKVSVYTGK